MYRIYKAVLDKHLTELKQMIFLAGPRQVGKTTIAQHILAKTKGIYLSWDIIDHREMILRGPNTLVAQLSAPILGYPTPIIVLDEIHKFKDWRNYLKGFLSVSGNFRIWFCMKAGGAYNVDYGDTFSESLRRISGYLGAYAGKL